MARDINLKTNSGVDYPGMKVKYIRIFSAVCIACGIASILMQTAALSMYMNTSDRRYISSSPSDVTGHGIWGGAFYVTVGGLGMAVTYMRKHSLLVATVVMSAISIFVSFLTAILSAVAASWVGGCAFRESNSICNSWLDLQWALVGCGILAFISSTALVILASRSLCLCTCCRKPKSTSDMPVTFQETFFHQLDHQLQ